MHNPILEIQNVSKEYVINHHKFIACNQIDFSVKEGEFLSIVGESGSGKSTLIKMIAQLEPTTSGNILFYGKNISSFTKKELRLHRQDMQMMFQDTTSSLNPKMKISQIICEPLLNFKLITKKEVEHVALQYLHMVELDESFLHKKPREMSGGQRQRVAIARALTLSPKVLLLDEPTSALDVINQAKILKLLKRLQKEYGLTILFVCHDIALVIQVSDRILVMQNGVVKEIIKPQHLLRDSIDPYTKELVHSVFDFKKCGCRFDLDDTDCLHTLQNYHHKPPIEKKIIS